MLEKWLAKLSEPLLVIFTCLCSLVEFLLCFFLIKICILTLFLDQQISEKMTLDVKKREQFQKLKEQFVKDQEVCFYSSEIYIFSSNYVCMGVGVCGVCVCVRVRVCVRVCTDVCTDGWILNLPENIYSSV